MDFFSIQPLGRLLSVAILHHMYRYCSIREFTGLAGASDTRGVTTQYSLVDIILVIQSVVIDMRSLECLCCYEQLSFSSKTLLRHIKKGTSTIVTVNPVDYPRFLYPRTEFTREYGIPIHDSLVNCVWGYRIPIVHGESGTPDFLYPRAEFTREYGIPIHDSLGIRYSL